MRIQYVRQVIRLHCICRTVLQTIYTLILICSHTLVRSDYLSPCQLLASQRFGQQEMEYYSKEVLQSFPENNEVIRKELSHRDQIREVSDMHVHLHVWYLLEKGKCVHVKDTGYTVLEMCQPGQSVNYTVLGMMYVATETWKV